MLTPDHPVRRPAAALAFALAALAAGNLAAQTSSLNDFAGRVADQPGGTTIYTAREFITMDPKKPRAEAEAWWARHRPAPVELPAIDAAFDGDAHFPAFDRTQWRETKRESGKSESGLGYAFVTYERA